MHNGIEYGDMQLLGEAYDCLSEIGGLSNSACAAAFGRWNGGALESHLVEITAAILATPDDRRPGPAAGSLVDQVPPPGDAWAAVSCVFVCVQISLAAMSQSPPPLLHTNSSSLHRSILKPRKKEDRLPLP